jgi:hypothetical protein
MMRIILGAKNPKNFLNQGYNAIYRVPDALRSLKKFYFQDSRNMRFNEKIGLKGLKSD